MASNYALMAPPLQVAQWFNTPAPIELAALRGRVVLLHAFQMLCPGCIEHGLPQARRVYEAFAAEQVMVLGLHTVFEHHAVQGTAAALAAFIHEYRLPFPVALDQPSAHQPVPRTMQALGLRGTPSMVVLDARGRVRLHHLGPLDDLQLGALLGQLVTERDPALPAHSSAPATARAAPPACTDGSCPAAPTPGPA